VLLLLVLYGVGAVNEESFVFVLVLCSCGDCMSSDTVCSVCKEFGGVMKEDDAEAVEWDEGGDGGDDGLSESNV